MIKIDNRVRIVITAVALVTMLVGGLVVYVTKGVTKIEDGDSVAKITAELEVQDPVEITFLEAFENTLNTTDTEMEFVMDFGVDGARYAITASGVNEEAVGSAKAEVSFLLEGISVRMKISSLIVLIQIRKSQLTTQRL